jgi:hypothetical protein
VTRDEQLCLELRDKVLAAYQERTGIHPPDVQVSGGEEKGFTVTVATYVRAPDVSDESVERVVSESLVAFEVHSLERDKRSATKRAIAEAGQ